MKIEGVQSRRQYYVSNPAWHERLLEAFDTLDTILMVFSPNVVSCARNPLRPLPFQAG